MKYNKDAEVITTYIEKRLGERNADAIALCYKYKTLAEETAKDSQGLEQGQFWTTQTGDAVQGIKGYAIEENRYAGWGLIHTEKYGKWLELKKMKKRRNEDVKPLLEPTVRDLVPFFMDDLEKIYAGK